MKDVIGMAMICATVAIIGVAFFYSMLKAGEGTLAYRTACMEQGGTLDGWTGNCVPK